MGQGRGQAWADPELTSGGFAKGKHLVGIFVLAEISVSVSNCPRVYTHRKTQNTIFSLAWSKARHRAACAPTRGRWFTSQRIRSNHYSVA
jgi:hypothetical protein